MQEVAFHLERHPCVCNCIVRFRERVGQEQHLGVRSFFETLGYC